LVVGDLKYLPLGTLDRNSSNLKIVSRSSEPRYILDFREIYRTKGAISNKLILMSILESKSILDHSEKYSLVTLESKIFSFKNGMLPDHFQRQ
jgi:hypothetical protein